MARLTSDLILESPQFLNTLGDRELDLRGHRIPRIENLGATENSFDTIDLSDNEIRALQSFPRLTRLHTLVLNNNKVTTLDRSVAVSLPSLRSLVLTNNKIENVDDVEALVEAKNLRSLSLIDNPCATARINDAERKEADALFAAQGASKKAKRKALKAAAETAGGAAARAAEKKRARLEEGLTEAEKKRIKQAIMDATSTSDVQRFENALVTGVMPPELIE